MNKEQIISLLQDKHKSLGKWLDEEGDYYWNYALRDKWNTGQIVLHLIQSERALNRALRLPKIFLRYKFGRPNRSERSFNEIVKKYREKLATNSNLVSTFSQNMILDRGGRKTYQKMLFDEHEKMVRRIKNNWSEKQLKNYLIPHPLMGRMLVSEILMWNAFHTEHHYLQIKKRADDKIAKNR